MTLLGIRIFFYNLIQFTHVAWLSVETLRGEIPLYVSEILIALCYMRVMVDLYQKQKHQKIDVNPEDQQTDIYEQLDNGNEVPEIKEV